MSRFKRMSKAVVSDVMLILNHFQHCYQFDLPSHHRSPLKNHSKGKRCEDSIMFDGYSAEMPVLACNSIVHPSVLAEYFIIER